MRGRRSGWRSRGECEGIRWRGACAFGFVSRTPGRLRDPPWGYYGPCARSFADGPPDNGTRKRGPKLRYHRKAMPRAAAGRREARRPASWAGHLRRSGDGPSREAGHRVRRFRTSACRRSAPPHFFRERRKTKGHPPPIQPGRRSFGCLTIESGDRASDATRVPRAPSPSPGGGGSVSKSEANASRGGVALNFTPPDAHFIRHSRSFGSASYQERRPKAACASPSRGGLSTEHVAVSHRTAHVGVPAAIWPRAARALSGHSPSGRFVLSARRF
jgi:hypothetical protein